MAHSGIARTVRWWPAVSALVLAALALHLLAPVALAHERWFVAGGDRPVMVEEIVSGVTLLALATMAVAVGLAWLAARVAGRRRLAGTPLERFGVRSLTNLYAWLPPVLAVHAAVPLIVSGVELRLFAPNLPLPRNLGGGLLALAEIAVALSFLYGAFTRAGAVLLAVTGLVGMFYFSPLLVLEHCDLLGIAVFLYITGRGPFSVDALIGGSVTRARACCRTPCRRCASSPASRSSSSASPRSSGTGTWRSISCGPTTSTSPPRCPCR